MDTNEFGKMMKRVQILEEGRVPAKETKNWRIEGEKKRISRKEYQWLLNKFEMEGLMAQEGLWNLAKEKIMKERGELLNEEGDAVREYKAAHEENFWSSWAREDLREVKKKGWQKPRRMKKKRVKRGKEKRKKRTTRGR